MSKDENKPATEDDGKVELLAPEGATDVALGGHNYKVKDGRVRIPREYETHLAQFGYHRDPAHIAAEDAAEAERIAAAQAEMDAANARDGEAAPAHEQAAKFLDRKSDAIVAELANLDADELSIAREVEVAGKNRKGIVEAIDALAAERQAKTAREDAQAAQDGAGA